MSPLSVFGDLIEFLDSGGNVLYVIMVATFLMWALIIERFAFFLTALSGLRRQGISDWQDRSDHTSWNAHKVRDMLVSRFTQKVQANLETIKTFVALAPLLGLLGTVTGMVEVFDTLSFVGASNARAMASGVSKATLPTMAGMTAALSGLFFSEILRRRASREIQKFADELELR